LEFKDLVLGGCDGTCCISLDFSIHAEKPLRGKHRKEQHPKECVPDSPGAQRRQECSVDKITRAITLIKRAVKQGSFQSSIVP
jgi:hypothetical protein